MFASWVRAPLLFIVLLASCGSGDQGEAIASTTAADSNTTTSAASDNDVPRDSSGEDASPTSSTSQTTIAASSGDDEPDPPVARNDWLTIANGLTLVSFQGNTSASDAVRTIDGEPTQIGLGTDDDGPVVFVFELPAPTAFDRFAVPDTRDSPGNTTFFGAIEVAGSATSATDGYEVLASQVFSELGEDEVATELIPTSGSAVRWIRLTLSGALQVEPEHEPGRTVVRFSELIGNGTQEPVPLGEAFTGIWELAFADNPDGGGDSTQLIQDGSRVVGCIGFADVTGTVTGNVVRLNGIDVRDERPSAYLLVVDGDGRLRGMESTRGGVFRARIGRIAPEGTVTRCGEEAPPPLACGSIAYVNFDLDSAAIRADSEPVLDDIFAGLSTVDDELVVIEGHTSTEGSADYNRSLSERRAQAVVDSLVARGIAAGELSAIGKGESEPLVSESDETSRALNRRVEISCS